MEIRRERELRTADLLRHAVTEARILARAEIGHAREEVKEELKAARGGIILIGVAAGLALCALSALLVALGIALPLPDAAGVALVGAAVLVLAVIGGLIGYKLLPKQPLKHTRERLRLDVAQAKEVLA